MYKLEFPLFEHRPELVYLDHAATSQKPKRVIDAIYDFYLHENGSPHRGAHALSVESTQRYEESKTTLLNFLGADASYDLIFTKNATEALNFVFYSYLESIVTPEDEILISIDSHHSIIVPAQQLAYKTKAKLKYLYVDSDGQLDYQKVNEAINEKTVLVALPSQNNALGNKHAIGQIIEKAHAMGAKVLVDGSQSVAHEFSNVSNLNIDFFAFSGHKMYGPQGIGALCVKKELLAYCKPFLTGGDTIEYVTEQTTSFAPPPERFEAGTQNVAGAVGLAEAARFIQEIGFEAIHTHESHLISKTLSALRKLPFIEILGPSDQVERGAVIAFQFKGVHPHDVASLLDESNVAIRAGHHCAQPLMQYLKIPASCRVSFGLYNTEKDIARLIEGLYRVKEVFQIGDE